MDFSKDQLKALEGLETGKNCFLTGKAGTGKSQITKEFIKRKKKENKNLIICASTGAAAQGLSEFGACTVHRAFGLKAKGIVEPPKKQKAEIEAADIVIIDEISMVRIDLFEHVASVILKINEERRKLEKAFKRKGEEPPKPIQLVVVGDFTQLPPVVTKDDKGAMKALYGNKIFAFESKLWKKLELTPLVLQVVHRQDKDQEYAEHLNEIRQCKISKDPFADTDTLQWFNENTSAHKFENENSINLCGKNDTASVENELRMLRLPGKTYTSEAKIKGDADLNSVTAEKILNYRVGAKIMMLTNGPDYFNGAIGYIKSVVNEGSPDEYVIVKIGENFIPIKKYEWAIFKPEVKEIDTTEVGEDGKVIKAIKKIVENTEVGSVIQYPFKLGYAVTIHKSQGMTLTCGVNLICEVNRNPEIWDSGQLYVALSRVDQRDNIYIQGCLQPKNWKLNSRVEKFYGSIDPEWGQ